MALFGRYNSIKAETRFMARCADGTTVEIQPGETFKLQDARDTDSGQVVHFATGAGLVTAISESPRAARPWRLSRV